MMKRKSTSAIAFALALTVGLGFSCGGKDDTDPPESDNPDPPPITNANPKKSVSDAECPSGTVWTWNNMGEGYLLNYCTMCHSAHLTDEARRGAPVGSDFDTPESVQVWRANIITRVAGEAPNMPPSLHIPAAETTRFLNWLNCGAPAGQDRIE
jgi:hypothetical protein